ncbi:g11736 [Coccomyxa viridis]|uniref:G11736 protein n=1 Tax=Coccomyxa viridis TaxID=1274662 RepID=A0ABP1GEA6_9CHLO
MTSQKIPQNKMGSQGFQTSQQGLGCMGMSFAYFPSVSDEEAISVIHRAQELGINHLDSSDMYGPHTNEQLVGKAISGQREKYDIATKFGAVHGPTGLGVRGDREYVRTAVEGSLKRLNIEQIDLYYQHRVDRDVEIEETWSELKELVKEGKVKYLGISEASAEEIRRAHAVHPITACQLEWSLWSRDVEEEVIPTLRELGIGIVAYSPLGRGFLTGTITSTDDFEPNDRRRDMPRWQKEAFEANMRMVDRVKDLASKKGCTAGQLALAWVHAQGPDVFPIPGTKRVKYLEENAAAYFIKLDEEDLKYLENTFSKDKVVGGRYAASHAKFLHDAKKTGAAA